MGKWVATIAAAVITAVLVSWLTGLGGLFNRKRADVKILSAEAACAPVPLGAGVATRYVMSRRVVATVNIVNEGNASALQCRAEWSDISSLPLEGGKATSSEFGLKAGDTKTVELWGYRPSPSIDRLDTTLAVICANASSPPHPVPVYRC